MTDPIQPRTYLVVIDDSAEARVALRFAARRAAKTGGTVVLLAIVPTPEFSQWSGVQETMAAEAHERAESLLAEVASEMIEEAGLRPSIWVKEGDPVRAVQELLATEARVDALVLGAAAKNGPGPLIAHFAGEAAGQLPCPVMIVPGGLSESALDRLS